MAMTETDIKIIIAAELKKQGFDKAQKATGQLDKTFKKLAGTLAATFSAQQIIAFGKASIKAFSDDEKAARRLTQTLGNMGLAFEDPRVKDFIAKLEATSGVLDDQLRPAMQSLLTTTGSVAKSQELLTLALDIAAGSGEDVVTVANDLSRAYVGNTKGLQKYKLGLNKTELATKSFSEIQALLGKQFSGQNAAFLETYAGKVSLIKVAYANLQETVGKSLVEAFALLAGPNGIGSATEAMNAFGIGAGETIAGVARLVNDLKTFMEEINKNPLVAFVMKTMGPGQGLLQFIDLIRAYGRTTTGTFNVGMSVTGATDYYDKQERDRKKAEEAARKRAAALAALQKKAELERIKREKEAQQLKRAGSIFDMENIQIVAAMQGKIDGEQRLRLVALLALNNSVADAAEKASTAVLAMNAPALANLGVIIKSGDSITDVIGKIINAQAKLALVDMGITNIPKAKNPFEDWDSILKKIIMDLDTIAAKIKGMPSVTPGGTVSSGGATGGGGGSGGDGGGGVFTVPNPFNPTAPAISTDVIANQIDTLTALRAGTQAGTAINFLLKEHIDTLTNATTLSSLSALSDEQARMRAMGIFDTPGITAGSRFDPGSFRMRENGAPVTVIVQGSVIAQQDLVEVITDQLYDNQKAGKGLLLSSTAI